MENVFLRGSQIKLIVLPEILKNAPIFKKVQQVKAASDADISRGELYSAFRFRCCCNSWSTHRSPEVITLQYIRKFTARSQLCQLFEYKGCGEILAT